MYIAFNGAQQLYYLYDRCIWPFSPMATAGRGNGLSLNTAPLMAETTNGRWALFLTMPSVVDYCGVIHCRAFASLSVLYGTLDSILFIVLFSHENSSSPPHSILGSYIPVRNINRKFHYGRFTLVLEAKLEPSNVTCARRQFPILHLRGILELSMCARRQFPILHLLGILELSMRATCPSHMRGRDSRMGYSD